MRKGAIAAAIFIVWSIMCIYALPAGIICRGTGKEQSETVMLILCVLAAAQAVTAAAAIAVMLADWADKKRRKDKEGEICRKDFGRQ